MATGPAGYGAPPPRGMSTATKVILSLSVLGIIGLALCCGAIGVAGRFFGTVISGVAQAGAEAIAQSHSADPKVIGEVTDRIAQVELPSGLRPQGSFNLRVPVSELPVFVAAWYVGESNEFLALAELNQDDKDANREALLEKFKIYLSKWSPEDILVEKSEERELVIRDQQAWFEFAEGKGERNEEHAYARVLGAFAGKNGPALFVYFHDLEGYDEARVMHIVESIR